MLKKKPLKVIIDTNLWISFLEIVGLEVEIISKVSVCRDAKDNYLLALAQDSLADFLITGDQDLLILKTFQTTVIST